MNQHELPSKHLSNKTDSHKPLRYGQRAQLCSNPVARTLLLLMEEKQTNLAVAADVTTKDELLALADMVGPEICIFKTHIDIITDFDWDLIEQLKALAQKHNFLIFEDRKFADIGNTVKLQHQGGVYHIAQWADIINAHTVSGPGIIDALQESSQGCGLLLLPQMSSKGNLAQGKYTDETIAMALKKNDFVIGFIAREQLVDDPRFIHMTPGVQLNKKNDLFGQQYLTPEQVILQNKSDIIIVGRGIYQAKDRLAAARTYRRAGWQAYQQRLF